MELAAFHKNTVKIWYRPGGRRCGGASVTCSNQHRSNAKRTQRNRTSFTSRRNKAGSACLLWSERCRRIDFLYQFISAGAAPVVYNSRDEGLQFADSSRQPLRRLRYQTQQTWQWRNPSTGASLRVSYPSEEVVLIPVSGQ